MGNKKYGVQRQAPGANLVAATTTDFSTATGNVFDITGNTTIVGLGTVEEGVIFYNTFTGTPLLTHNATSLQLPGEANIQVVAGDRWIVKSLGSGNFVVLAYIKKNGKAVVETAFDDSTLLAAVNGLSKKTYPLGESFTGATTPQSCFVLDDLFQFMFIGIYRLGTVSNSSGYAGKRGVKFIPRSNVTAQSLSAILCKNNSPSDNIFCSIQTDSAGSPSGTVITNGTSANIAGSSVSSSIGEWKEFTFASAFSLVAGTTYWLVFERTGANSDTDHYYLGCDSGSEDYGSFDGKSYISNWNAADTNVPVFRIKPSSGGGSKSLWKTDSDATAKVAHMFHGFCTTTGSAGASGTIYDAGIVSGFSSLLPYVDYYADSTAGSIINSPDGVYVGEAYSATQIAIPKIKVSPIILLGIVSTTLTNASMANGVWLAPFDGEIIFTNSADGATVSNLAVTIADSSNMSSGAKTFYLDDPTNGHRHTLSISVRKGQFVKVGNTGAGAIDTIAYIPRF